MRIPVSVVLAASFCLPIALVSPSGAQEPVIESAPGVLIVESIDDSIDTTSPEAIERFAAFQASLPIDPERVEPAFGPDGTLMASAVSGLSVDYNSSYPAPTSVRTIVNSAVSNWNSVLATGTGPVEIEVYWQCLSPGLLGMAGPVGFFRNDPGLPTGDWYPAGLANTLTGLDVNDNFNSEALPEVQVILNAALLSGNSCGTEGGVWYVGTNGNPSSGQVDLYSVVLHEVGHGLGFLGSGTAANGGSPALESPNPYGFDRQVLYNGTSLLNASNPNSLLTSNALSINVGSGWAYKLYAPSTWEQGSSFSHFDESTSGPGTAGAIMTPALGPGETERTIDAPTAGVMSQIGWPVKVKAVRPANLTTSVSGSTVSASWDIDMTSKGLPPSSHVVKLYADGVLKSTITVAGTAKSASLSGFVSGKNHKLVVTPFGPGGAGTSAELSSAAPTPVKVSGTGTSRVVGWPAAPSSAPVNSYTVQRQANGGAWTNVANPTERSTTASGLPDGSIVQFRVRANTTLGTSAWTYSTLIGISTTIVRPFPLDGQVGRLYLAYFQRQGDAGGFSHWLRQRANGLDINAISAAFADSPEFQQTYGSLNNQQFVDLIYQNVLGRAGEAEGRSFWTTTLNKGTSRGAVMVAFADSPEFVTKTKTAALTASTEASIYRLYVAFFLRFPDQGGMNFWIDMRNRGTSLDAVAGEFANSEEFQARYGSLSNKNFVELVYRNVLVREADAAGLDYWTGLLNSGRSRGSVMTGFSESVEFILLTGSLP